MIKKLLFVLCMFFVVGVVSAMPVAGQYSTNWGWKWEGDVYPLATGLMEANWFSPGTPDHLTFEAATMGLTAGPPTYANIPATTARGCALSAVMSYQW